ncbi:hypothetical protein PR048_004811 [Dryococelus australis]|uniref:Peptidase A2 domain-containing protein n=1 Tax=Dryococelus australis TaxID=614101 RepID=A0ABQ9I6F6_9NEOP|nr:hypothetical protein PR048_004811 [Dryococelus australis]
MSTLSAMPMLRHKLVGIFVNTITIKDTVRGFLLNEPNDEVVNNQEILCPELLLDVCGIQVPCLLDSGAEISCISEKMVNRILVTDYKLPTVPVPRLRIIGATSKITLSSIEYAHLLRCYICTRSEVFGLNELPSLPISLEEVATSAEERREEMLQFVKRKLILATERRRQLVLTLALNVRKHWFHITKNLLQHYEGPYEISCVINKKCYELKDPITGEIVGNFNLTAL